MGLRHLLHCLQSRKGFQELGSMMGEHGSWEAHLHPPTQPLSKARGKELTFTTVWLALKSDTLGVSDLEGQARRAGRSQAREPQEASALHWRLLHLPG